MFIEQGGITTATKTTTELGTTIPLQIPTGYIEPWLKSAPFVQGL